MQIATPAAALAPHFNGARVVGVRPGTPLLHRLAVSGQAPLTLDAQNLPKGIVFDEKTGILSGTAPTAEGATTLTLSAKNAVGSAMSTLRIVVSDTLALTPPIGWNSYDSFDDAVKESEVLEQAAWLRDHLQPYGWDTVVVDFRWYDPQAPSSDQGGNNPQLVTDESGRLLPAPNRFPSAGGGVGFKALADQVHAMGLKFGIHIMRGIARKAVDANAPIAGSNFTAKDAVRAAGDNGYVCGWNSDMYGVKGDSAAGQAWYDSLFAQYASWGVDFVKVDDTTKNRPANAVEYFQTEVEAIQNAIHKSRRSIVLSLSPGEALTSAAAHLTKFANMWRVSDDFWDRSADLDHSFVLAQRWVELGSVGHWPDEDMLPIGHLGPRCPVDGADRGTRFSKNEQQLMLSLWAILSSPYMLGANLVASAQDDFFLSLLQNEEVIAVQQDGAGKKAKRVSGDADSSIWTRELADGKLAVGFFNQATTDKPQSVSTSALGMTEKRLVHDAWQRTDLPAVMPGDELEVKVPGRAAALLLLSPEAPPSSAGGVGGAGGVAGQVAVAGSESAGVGGASGGTASAGTAPGGAAIGGNSDSIGGAAMMPQSPQAGSDSGCGCRSARAPQSAISCWLVAVGLAVLARRFAENRR